MKFFFDFFFGEIVAWDFVQLLAKTWSPCFLGFKKFEMWAHVTKSAKKTPPYRHSRKARGPKKTKSGETLGQLKTSKKLLNTKKHY